MHLIEVTSDNKQQVDRFTLLPFSLYRGCPQWVPPLLSEARAILDPRKHPFYQHSRAAFFLVESEGQALGRLAVMENRNHNAYRQAKTAFFGFFEVIEDRQASAAIFEAAFAWARQSGLNRIIGPRGLVGTDGGGILVEGFEHRPALGVPYNLPYYDAFIREAGFEKDTDHLSGYLPGDHVLPERLVHIAKRVKQRRGYTVKSFSSKAEMREWAPRVVAVHRAAFANTHTFYPPTQAEMDSIISTLIDIADPPLIKLLLKDEQVVGFIFAYQDFSAGLQKSGGRLWPFGWYHLLRERRRLEWVNINGVGLHPDHQGLGGNTVLYLELRKSLSELGFKHMEIVQVNETNFSSRSDMEAIGVRWYKRHRSNKRDL